MLPQSARGIHWSELPPAQPSSQLAVEYETYRRAVGRLLAEGNEGKFALIKGETIIGIYDTHDEAHQVGLQRYLLDGYLIQPILEYEPIVRTPLSYCPCQH